MDEIRKEGEGIVCGVCNRPILHERNILRIFDYPFHHDCAAEYPPDTNVEVTADD